MIALNIMIMIIIIITATIMISTGILATAKVIVTITW